VHGQIDKRVDDPFESFTDWQWYSQQSRQSVYYAAFSATAYTVEMLRALARDLIRHAPQLVAHLPGRPDPDILPDTLLDRIITRCETNDLSAYPDCQPVDGQDIFDALDLPMVRLHAVVRSDGPDAEGRTTCIVVVSSHALLEGADSALLSRSRDVGRPDIATEHVRPAWPYLLLAAFLVPIQLIISRIMLPRVDDRGFVTMAFSRARLRALAKKFDVRQRSLIFALAAYALNENGALKRRSLSVIYTDLDAVPEKGQFFRFRMVESKFRVHTDFKDFVTGIDKRISADESANSAFSHAFIGALMNRHRALKNSLPFLYTNTTFRFTGFYDLDLSLVPPHRLQGALSAGLMEPVYCGTSHPGLQSCVFSPGEKWITFNFNMRAPHLARAKSIPALVDRLEAD